MKKTLFCAFLLVCIAACDSKEPAVRHEPIVVYASYADEAYLTQLFAGFTEESGIPVVVAYDSSEVHARNLIFNIGSPPVDVFLSREVADLWHTADEGALRPISAAHLANVPESMRDLDGLWTAVNYQHSLIVHRSDVDAPMPVGLGDFANAPFKGRLCVGSASLPANRLILSMMIEDLGLKQAERVVRNWMRNLAAAPFKTEDELLTAVRSGECEFGIVSGWQSSADLGVIIPQPAYIQIEGIGVARHSRYPESAQKLVNWMLSDDVNQQHAHAQNAIPVIGRQFDASAGQAPAVAGWNDNEARLLAERASYR